LEIPLLSISVELDGLQDLRGFLAVDDRTRAGFQRIAGTVTVESPASDADIERLKRVVDRHCPVLDDLRTPVTVELAWRRAGAGR
jgi:hypothetical protein